MRDLTETAEEKSTKADVMFFKHKLPQTATNHTALLVQMFQDSETDYNHPLKHQSLLWSII